MSPVGFISCRPLPKRGKNCYIPAASPQSLNGSFIRTRPRPDKRRHHNGRRYVDNLPSLTSDASATSQFRCRALLDTGSPWSFIQQGAFEQMVATGAADESYVRPTLPRSWSGFGSPESLNTNRQARLTIQFYHNDAHSASHAVWIYIVPNKTMRCPFLLGRNSWMRFHSRSYQTLAPKSDSRIYGELTLSLTFDDAYNSAAAYIRIR